jgi:hypothetical protein
MFKKLLLYSLFLVCTATYSQVGGKYTYQFLNLTSPRQAALGGKTITIYDDDVNQVNFNPATINVEMDNHLALNYGSYYGEVTYSFLCTLMIAICKPFRLGELCELW